MSGVILERINPIVFGIYGGTLRLKTKSLRLRVFARFFFGAAAGSIKSEPESAHSRHLAFSLLPVFTWRKPDDSLKLLVKVGEIVEPAGIAYFRNIEVPFHQQLAGIGDTHFGKILKIAFAGMGFEIPAEG